MSSPPPDHEMRRYPSQSHVQGDMQPPMGPNQPYGPGQMAPQHHYGQPPHQMMQQQQSNTTVIINQPETKQNRLILGPRGGHRDWSSGLCSCCDDVGKCMLAYFCPCYVQYDIATRLGECACVLCCVPGALATVRTRVRTLGGIRGSICMDYLAAQWCMICVMCQVHRELDYMGL